MALYMLMARYSPTALKAIIETGSDREAAARAAVEAAGGKLLGFYGMFGQDYGLAMIVEAPGHAEYIGAVSAAISSGTFESYKTIALYTWADIARAMPIAKRGAYGVPASGRLSAAMERPGARPGLISPRANPWARGHSSPT